MILILNQFPENDPAPTSRYLREISLQLRSEGNEVCWISGGESYQKHPPSFLLRALRDLFTGFRLLWSSLWLQKPQLIISSSSPPGILIISVILKFWHQCHLTHWAMDLHPDVSIALGEKPPFLSIFKKLAELSYPYCDLILTLDEGMQKHLHKCYGVKSLITPLWPLHTITATQPPQQPPQWLYSGNLGKAHESQTLLAAQHLLESKNSRYLLVLQGNAQKRLQTDQQLPQQILFQDYSPDEQFVENLLSSHILIATQNPKTDALLWPSKLALITRLPRPLIWIGKKNSSISHYLKTRPHTGIFEPGESSKIADWVLGYSSLPAEDEFKEWIQAQPIKSTSLVQVIKWLSPLFQAKASLKVSTDE